MPSEKVLAQGSTEPAAVPQGSIRVYSMRFCPYAQRTRLVLNAKGIKHEVVNIHLKDKPDWFLRKNPLGLVPTLETSSGDLICESPITCEYLDEVYPGKKLFPSTPLERAHQKMLLEQFSKIPPLYFKIATGKRKGEDISTAATDLKEHFKKLDTFLVHKKSKFFDGDSITMIDYLMWPWFERLEAFDVQQYLDGNNELKKYIGRMFEDPVVKASGYSTDTYKAFYETYMSGAPNFDLNL